MNLGDHLESVTNVCKYMHMHVASTSREFLERLGRSNYVTPTSYLELLGTYKKVLASKRLEVGTTKDRLQKGLDKMISTADMVGKLQIDIKALQPVLVKTVAEVEEMIINVNKDKDAAAVTQAAVAEEESAAQEKAKSTQAIADSAQRDLGLWLGSILLRLPITSYYS